MANQTEKKILSKQEISRLLTAVRTSIVLKYPFYGSLLMSVTFALGSCGTAGTDMRRIIWDPEWISGLSMEEIEFVCLHEILHIVLQHPVRSRGFQKMIYNIAADIVINSMILQSLGKDTMIIDGEEAMHLTPKGTEGFKHTTEEVYLMLLDEIQKNGKRKEMDNHDTWEVVSQEDAVLINEWEQHVQNAVKTCGDMDLPPALREFVKDLDYRTAIDWKMQLQDFIQISTENHDYTFTPYDRRFACEDFILPAYNEIEEETIENLWFLIDISGSITDEMMTIAHREITSCLEQFISLKGKLSFFDTKVTAPVAFENASDLAKIRPVGGGGTSFSAIFRCLKENMSDNLPKAMIILTDGYSIYPEKEVTLDVPVLWILVNQETDAPWGKTIHLRWGGSPI